MNLHVSIPIELYEGILFVLGDFISSQIDWKGLTSLRLDKRSVMRNELEDIICACKCNLEHEKDLSNTSL